MNKNTNVYHPKGNHEFNGTVTVKGDFIVKGKVIENPEEFLARLIVCLEENPDLARRLRVALANAGSIGVPA